MIREEWTEPLNCKVEIPSQKWPIDVICVKFGYNDYIELEKTNCDCIQNMHVRSKCRYCECIIFCFYEIKKNKTSVMKMSTITNFCTTDIYRNLQTLLELSNKV